MSKVKWLIAGLAVLTLSALLGVWTVLSTQAGASWALSIVESQLEGDLQVQTLKGDLGSGLVLHGVSFTDDGLAVGARSIQFAVNLGLFPLRVHIQPLHIDELEVQLAREAEKSDDDDDSLPEIDLPLEIRVTDLAINGLQVINADDEAVFIANQLGADIELVDSLVIRGFRGSSDDVTVALDADLGLASPYALHIDAEIEAEVDLGDSALVPLKASASLNGALEQELDISLTSEDPNLTMSGVLENPVSQPVWAIELNTDSVSWPLDPTVEPMLSIASLKLQSRGRIDEFSVNARGSVTPKDLSLINFELIADGGETGLQIEHLALDSSLVDLNASGDLTWEESLAVSVAVVMNQLDASAVLEEWPVQHPLTGRLDVRYSETGIEIPDLEFNAIDTTLSVSGHADIDMVTNRVSADLVWKDLNWPPGDSPRIASPDGKLVLSGDLDDWSVDGTADVQAEDLPEGRLNVRANGDREQATIEIVEGQVLGGVISGSADLSWAGEGIWSARLNSEGLQTARLLPEWPATVDVSVSASGQAYPLRFDASVERLQGTYRTLPISATGQFGLADDSLWVRNFDFALDSARVRLDGRADGADGLQFSVEALDLSRVPGGARGLVNGAGSISLLTGNEYVAANLEIAGLEWNEVRIESLSVVDRQPVSGRKWADFQINATGLELADQRLDSIQVDISADPSAQSLQLAASHLDTAISVALGGTGADLAIPPSEWDWDGEIRQLTITESDRLALRLSQPSSIRLSAGAASVETTCLTRGVSDIACFEGSRLGDGSLSMRVRLNEMPLSLAQPFLDTDFEFNQTLTGELSWSNPADADPSGVAEFRLSPGDLRYVDDPSPLLETGEGLVAFRLNAGQLTQGQLDIPFPGLGEIDFDLDIPDWSGIESNLKGHLNANLSDLDIITLFVPGIDRADGRFRADLDLRGTIFRPVFTGSLSLQDGMVQHDSSGLRLTEIEISGDALGNMQSTLNGSFRALEGKGVITADLDMTEISKPRMTMALTGQDLKLFNSPDMEVVAAPDVRIGWQPGSISIDGQILLPRVHLQPNQLPSSSVSESPDLVIVAGAPEESVTEEENRAMSLNGTLDVTLGDDVRLVLDYARVDVTGSTSFTWEDGPIPVANGQYRMEGRINVLGQRLEITRGVIGFPGVPADNPHLDVRAERDIYGNSEIRRAGVFVNGTLRRFTMEPYTEPPTNRDRARTLLVTGSDFNMEQGVGAVDIGTYIAPRIFVAYGIGVFEDENVFSVRYDLGRGWGIKATSGQRQTGLDLSYTIER